MTVSYKNGVLRSGWDCTTDPVKLDRYACWSRDFERELEIRCDKVGINPDLVGANVEDVHLNEDPKDYARRLVRKTMRRLRMI